MAEAFLRVGGLLPERGYTRTLSRVQVKEEGCVVRFIPVYKGVPVLTDDYGAQLVVAQDGVAEMTCRWPVFADSAILEPREDRLVQTSENSASPCGCSGCCLWALCLCKEPVSRLYVPDFYVCIL